LNIKVGLMEQGLCLITLTQIELVVVVNLFHFKQFAEEQNNE